MAVKPESKLAAMSMLASLDRGQLDSHLVSAGFIADPYETLRQMRDEMPVYWSDSVGGWLITRFDDVMYTFKHTKEYSNEGRLGRAAVHVPLPDRERLEVFEEHYRTKGLLHSDPPDHALAQTDGQCVHTQPDRGHEAAHRTDHRVIVGQM